MVLDKTKTDKLVGRRAIKRAGWEIPHAHLISLREVKG